MLIIRSLGTPDKSFIIPVFRFKGNGTNRTFVAFRLPVMSGLLKRQRGHLDAFCRLPSIHPKNEVEDHDGRFSHFIWYLMPSTLSRRVFPL